MNRLIISILFFTISVYSQDSGDNISNVKDSTLTLIDGVFAVIGDHVIFHSDIHEQILQYQTQGSNIENLREQVIEDLFFQKMLLHFAAIDSVQIDANEIENTINQRILFFEQQLGSQEKIEEYFQKSIVELVNELNLLLKISY